MRLPLPPDLSRLDLPAGAREALDAHFTELHAAIRASVISESPGIRRSQLPGGASLHFPTASPARRRPLPKFSGNVYVKGNLLPLGAPTQLWVRIRLDTGVATYSAGPPPIPFPPFEVWYYVPNTFGDIVIP